jgi:mannose-1-phosphate guanylyltransferase
VFCAGANVVVAPGARVRDAIVMEGTTIDVSVTGDIMTRLSLSKCSSLHIIVTQKHACVQNSIVGKHCKIGPWGRVDGAPEDPMDTKNQLNITILGQSSLSDEMGTF